MFLNSQSSTLFKIQQLTTTYNNLNDRFEEDILKGAFFYDINLIHPIALLQVLCYYIKHLKKPKMDISLTYFKFYTNLALMPFTRSISAKRFYTLKVIKSYLKRQ